MGRIVQLQTGLIVVAWPLTSLAWNWEFDKPINLFLDNSYIAFSPSPIKVNGDPRSPAGLIFESQIASNFFLPHYRDGEIDSPSGEYVLSAVLTPLTQLRMLNEQSSPVIPPSFKPKVTFQLLRLKQWTLNEGKEYRFSAIGTNLIVGHYSNGQAGCFFANQTGTDPNCVPAHGQLPLNEVSGSFSTNYGRIELLARYLFDGNPVEQAAWIVGGSAELDRNSDFGPGGISTDQSRVYGKGHFGFGAAGERYLSGNRWVTSVALSFPFGETPRQEPTVTVEATFISRVLSGFGFFARYVNGQDYYNILFLEHVVLWQFGLSFQLGPGFRALPVDLETLPSSK